MSTAQQPGPKRASHSPTFQALWPFLAYNIHHKPELRPSQQVDHKTENERYRQALPLLPGQAKMLDSLIRQGSVQRKDVLGHLQPSMGYKKCAN